MAETNFTVVGVMTSGSFGPVQPALMKTKIQ